MKKTLGILIALLVLVGCSSGQPTQAATEEEQEVGPTATEASEEEVVEGPLFSDSTGTPEAAVLSPDGDADSDGLTNAQEAERGTEVNYKDSDADGLYDGTEVSLGTSPVKSDSDGDKISDSMEVIYIGSNPLDPDSDADHDSVPDYVEAEKGTDALNGDTDNDFVGDLWEIYYFGTNPSNDDTDEDGCPDGVELTLIAVAQTVPEIGDFGISPLKYDKDSDGDLLPDLVELKLRLDPLDADSDNDGIEDGIELYPLFGIDWWPPAPDSGE